MNALEAITTANEATAPGGPVALRLLRGGTRLLCAAAPPLAARLVERLWFTPPRPTIRPSAIARLASGAHERLLVDGGEVAMWSWGDGPPIVLVHGWGGFAAQMTAFVEPLVAAGHRVVAFDAPGHGASAPGASGTRLTSLIDFATVLHFLEKRDGPAHAVIAHSGGCTAAAWAMRQGLTPSRVVWLAPMASPIRYARMFGDTLGISDAVMATWQQRAERRLGFRWEDLEMAQLPRVVRTPPALVVHDREDRETAWDEGESIARAWPAAELLTTSGLGHRRILREDAVVERAREFVAAECMKS